MNKLPLDPLPYVGFGWTRYSRPVFGVSVTFNPRGGYSQNEGDYR